MAAGAWLLNCTDTHGYTHPPSMTHPLDPMGTPTHLHPMGTPAHLRVQGPEVVELRRVGPAAVHEHGRAAGHCGVPGPWCGDRSSGREGHLRPAHGRDVEPEEVAEVVALEARAAWEGACACV